MWDWDGPGSAAVRLWLWAGADRRLVLLVHAALCFCDRLPDAPLKCE